MPFWKSVLPSGKIVNPGDDFAGPGVAFVAAMTEDRRLLRVFDALNRKGAAELLIFYP